MEIENEEVTKEEKAVEVPRCQNCGAEIDAPPNTCSIHPCHNCSWPYPLGDCSG